ncbi:MAG: Dabb family protein [Gloeomargaritaceae cyanobacterium C42_A2020_066]|nr:Dabb family protein [Gloeomargaritaceae cyanobacterium C42_A2020_066]
MIKHVVFFKFKAEVGRDARDTVLAELQDLPGQIEAIRSFEVGLDVLHSPRSWDAVLIGTYNSLQDLETYMQHPAHRPVAEQLRNLCEAIATVDYET